MATGSIEGVAHDEANGRRRTSTDARAVCEETLTKNANFCSHATSDPRRVGVVVSTHACLPYVHLQLALLRRRYPTLPVMVHDDASPQSEDIAALCRQYGAAFCTTERRLGHTAGDMMAFAAGLDWASEGALDYLVKFSRRWVFITDWLSDLSMLIDRARPATVSSWCDRWGFGFRTECMALHVGDWMSADGPRQFRAYDGSLPEAFTDRIAASVPRSPEFERWMDLQPPYKDGHRNYARWGLMRNRKDLRVDWLLWHETHSASDYAIAARAAGLDYHAGSFKLDGQACTGHGLATQRVTVCITNWNYGRWLADAIRSVQLQTKCVDDWYIVDDGSDDSESLAIYTKYPDRVHYNGAHLGAVAAYNHGLERCRTEWIVYLDADDELDPLYVELMLREARCQGVAWVYCDAAKTDADGRVTDVIRYEPFSRATLQHHNFIHSAALVRADVVRQAGAWVEAYPEDWHLWKRVADKGYVASWVQEPLLRYRHHGESRNNGRRGK